MTATEALDLNQVGVFVRVIETGSFTAAARTLGLPKSSVSRRVSALEESLRVRLLQRGSRKLVLTEAGRMYFERARAALAGLADANAAVTDMSREIAGPIRFTTGGDNTGMIANLVSEFLGRYPKVQLDVVLTPRRVDLVTEGFDLALRAGPLVDSSLVVRRLGRSDHGLFASRAYLRKAGTPRRVSDLRAPPLRAVWRATPAGAPSSDRPSGRRDGEGPGAPRRTRDVICCRCDRRGGRHRSGARGLSRLGPGDEGRVARSAARELVRVLADYRSTGSELNLVSPPTAYEPTRVALLRDFLAERLRPLMQACSEAAEGQRAKRRLTVERLSPRRKRSAEPVASAPAVA